MPNTQKAKSRKEGKRPTRGHSIIPSLPYDVSLRILALLPLVSYSALGLVCRALRDAMRPDGPVIATRNRLNFLETWIVFVSERDEDFHFLLVDPAHRGCLEIVCPLPEPIHSAPSPIALYTSPMATGNEILMPAPYYYIDTSWQDFNSHIMYCFDVQRMQWKDPLSLLTPGPHQNCYSHYASAALDGYLYVAGGDLGGISKKAARLDIASKTWEALPDLTEKRIHASAVVLQGRICIVGGICVCHSGLKVVDSGEIWDPNSRQWTLIHELWPADIFGKQSHRPCIAVVEDRLYALRLELDGKLQELMYYEDTSKLWISMGKFCFPALVESKNGFRWLKRQPCRMVGVSDELFVFCCAEPLEDAKPKDALLYMVALYVKPNLSEPLTWGVWPLFYPADYNTQPLISHV